MSALHFAVVVGINRYPAISDLQHAQADAREFYEWVTSAGGGRVATTQAHLITATLAPSASRRDAEPTRQRILDALEQCVEECKARVAAQPGDWKDTRLYFFAAGHGIAPGPRDAALLTANASLGHLNEHISCASLLDYFSRVQHFKQLVLFADCCRTEERLATPLPPPWTEDSVNRGSVRKFFAAGARFFQRSFERLDGTPDEQRGYFTRALLDGLSGGAIDPADPGAPIKASILKGTVTEHMRRNSKARFPLRPLEPDFLDEGIEEVFFGPPRPQAAAPARHPVRITIRSEAVANLVISSGESGSALLPAQREVAGGNVFLCDLPVGLWEAVPLLGAPPVPSPRDWVFKVKEGGNEHAF